MYNTFRRFSIALFLQLLFIHLLVAQTVTVQTVLDTNRILPGKIANLKFIVNKQAGINIKMPVFNDTLFDGIELIGNAIIDSGNSLISQNKIEQKLVVTAYEPGMRFIPAQPFVLISSSGSDTIYSAPGYLFVDSVAIDTSGVIRDIKKVEWIMPTPRDFIPFMIVLGILGFIAFLIIYFWPGSRERIKRSAPGIFEPAHIVALRELDKLKAQKLWQQKQTKEYYSRLTAIIRTYIEQQFGIRALEETSAEIIKDLKNKSLDSKLNIIDLQKLLNLADLVKFAKGEAQPEENIEHLERAYDFIKSSRQAIMENAIKTAADVVKDNLSNSFQIAKKSRNAKGLSDLQIFQELENGGRLVRYQYTISIIVMTFILNSKIQLLRSQEKGIKQGLFFSIITILLGWWGIPWGPIRSIIALKNNFSGGKDVELE